VSSHRTDKQAISADEAILRLKESHARFAKGTGHFSKIRKEIFADLAKGQHPYATILTCSDSRVPPELIFDAGLGELFVIRVAGNVLSPEVSGSLQYANMHLRIPLFVVLGHEGCGAVHAALETKLQGVRQLSYIKALVDGILPALDGLDAHLPMRELLSKAVEANVRWTMRQILESAEDKALLAEGKVNLVGAIYEIESGKVRFLDGA